MVRNDTNNGIGDRNDISEQKTKKAETNIIKNDNKHNTINSAHETYSAKELWHYL